MHNRYLIVDVSSENDVPSFWWCLLVDTLLLWLFLIQHSGMASMWWKEKLFALGLGVLDRSIYVLASAGCIQVRLKAFL